MLLHKWGHISLLWKRKLISCRNVYVSPDERVKELDSFLNLKDSYLQMLLETMNKILQSNGTTRLAKIPKVCDFGFIFVSKYIPIEKIYKETYDYLRKNLDI